MTRHERDEVMRYVGQLEGICSVIAPVEGEYEEDSTIIFEKLKEIASDLECLVKGYDKLGPSNLTVFTGPAQEGGDGDDV